MKSFLKILFFIFTMLISVGEAKSSVIALASSQIGADASFGAIRTAPNAAKTETTLANQGSEAVLKNGYYEVNGFKFSEYYYNKLWTTGRGAPSLVAGEVLQGGLKTAVPDALKVGFNKYTYGGWEMIYHPVTKEVWHLQPIW